MECPTPAELPPLFVGYFEESHYLAPHYQSIVPFKNNAILRFITENGGSAVADNLGIIDSGKSLACSVLFIYH
jgi:hypothetical protein